MNRKLPFMLVSSGSVLAVTLVAGVFAPGTGVANAIDGKGQNKPTPTPSPTQTTPPPPVADGPGCFNPGNAHLFWHRDSVLGGSTKLNTGSLAATVFLGSDNCPGEVYRFQVLDDSTGTQVLAQYDVTANEANEPAVILNQVLHLGGAAGDAVDTNDQFVTLRVQVQIMGAGVVITRPANPAGVPGGVEVTDGDTGSPAQNGFS